MTPAPQLAHDEQRLCRLEALALLDTAGEPEFDTFTRLASEVTGMPVALVSLVDRDRQWFKSAVGLPQGAQTGRAESFCGHAIAGDGIFEVEDATRDPRFHDNPLVTGAPHVVHYAGAPIVMPGGEAIGTICLIDRKPGLLQPHERKLLCGLARAVASTMLMREREQQLQRALAQRNADLQQSLEAERQARQAAQDASRAKDDFLATMSHELRTPLNGILGFSQVLEGALDDPQQRQQVRYIRETGETLTRILNDVLDIAKIESGKFDLDPRPFDMDQVFESCTSLFRTVATGKGLAFDASLAPGLPRLVGDPVRLRQVLHNLLSNAFKFTAQGQVRLSVQASALEAAPGGRPRTGLRIRVEDTGMGMSPGQLQRLFQRFEQADRSIAGRFGGTGLGLAIVKALVDKMDGTVAVRSREGAGTEFELDIPFTHTEAPAPAPAAIDPQQAEPPLHVLVVDDFHLNRHVLRALLEKRGHRVSEAEDGVQALAQVAQLRPDLVLMDLDMPHMDGLEATRRLRARAVVAGGLTPVYALTGKAFAEDIERARQAGMDGHLAKPVQLAELVPVLRAIGEPSLGAAR